MIECKYCRVIAHYGAEHQIGKALEELKELRLELFRAKAGKPDKEAIMSEMADVHNMLIQLQMIFGIDGEKLIAEIERKMERTTERIDKEVNHCEQSRPQES